MKQDKLYNACEICNRVLSQTGDLRCRCKVRILTVKDYEIEHNDIMYFGWNLSIGRLCVSVLPHLDLESLVWRTYINGKIHDGYDHLHYAIAAAIRILTTAPLEQFENKQGDGK